MSWELIDMNAFEIKWSINSRTFDLRIFNICSCGLHQLNDLFYFQHTLSTKDHSLSLILPFKCQLHEAKKILFIVQFNRNSVFFLHLLVRSFSTSDSHMKRTIYESIKQFQSFQLIVQQINRTTILSTILSLFLSALFIRRLYRGI